MTSKTKDEIYWVIKAKLDSAMRQWKKPESSSMADVFLHIHAAQKALDEHKPEEKEEEKENPLGAYPSYARYTHAEWYRRHQHKTVVEEVKDEA